MILDTTFHGHDTNQAAYDQLHAAGVDKWAPNDVIYHQLSGGLTLEARVMGDGSGRWEMRVDRWRRPITRRPGRDRSQAWRYRNHKMRRDAVVPIDNELTTMIEAQQVRARQRFPDTAVLLPRGHANPDGRFPIHTGTFDMRLKRWLADAVTDELGRPVKVTPHQFRHTYATQFQQRRAAGSGASPARPHQPYHDRPLRAPRRHHHPRTVRTRSKDQHSRRAHRHQHRRSARRRRLDETEPVSRENGSAQRILRSAVAEIVSTRQRTVD